MVSIVNLYGSTHFGCLQSETNRSYRIHLQNGTIFNGSSISSTTQFFHRSLTIIVFLQEMRPSNIINFTMIFNNIYFVINEMKKVVRGVNRGYGQQEQNKQVMCICDNFITDLKYQIKMIEQSSCESENEHKFTKKYKFLQLLFILLVEILILFMYGFFSYFSHATTTYLPYIYTNLLAALGFGLLLCYFKYALKQALIITLFVVSLNTQISPLLQKFWNNVFLDGFKTDGTDHMLLSFDYVRISTFCSISLLAGLSGVIGKITMMPLIFTTIIFNIGYFLNSSLNAYILTTLTQTTILFDDFNGSRIFMFGAGFGLGLLVIYSKINSKAKTDERDHIDVDRSLPLFIGVLVTLSSIFFINSDLSNVDFTILTVFFALSASILMSMAMSCIIYGAVWLKDLVLSIFSGVIQISIIIKLISHPFVAIAIGGFAGLVSPILMFIIDRKINKSSLRDTKGLFAFYFLNAFLAIFLVAPIIIKAYNTQNAPSEDWNEGHVMIFGAISLGIGLVLGIISGLLGIPFKEDIFLNDLHFFGYEFEPVIKRKSGKKSEKTSELPINKQQNYQDNYFQKIKHHTVQQLGSEINLF